MWQRMVSIIIKEFIQLSRDRRSMAMVFALPIIQMCILGYVVRTDIENVSLVVWDASNTAESRELIQSFDQTEFFNVNYYALDYEEIASRIESGDAKGALVIPPEYARDINRGEAAQVQFFTDGSEPGAGIQSLANANLIVSNKGAELMSKKQLSEVRLPISLQPRIWYNPAMQSSVFYLPGFVGILLQNITIILTSIAIVRERERGTMEQLNISPLRRGELIVGKLIPYVIIGYAQLLLVVATAIVVFGMPMRGNFLLLLVLSSVFLMFSLSLGLLVSTISQNQFQAMQASFMVLVPTVFLSGFIFPVESMPRVAQWIASVIPLTYYLRILRGIVVKGVGIEYLWQDALILGAMTAVTLTLATVRIRKSLD
ncbi:MAG TPA: ABC transporter permease [Dehalococcoidia bacterium]|nr:ABC transporter permease [Dehalococcoidia bacterium]